MTDVVVYGGRTFIGSIIGTPAGFVAKDAAGRKIGVFKTSAEASRAVFAARDRPPKPRRCYATP